MNGMEMNEGPTVLEIQCGNSMWRGRTCILLSHPGASMAVEPSCHSSISGLGDSATSCYGEMFC